MKYEEFSFPSSDGIHKIASYLFLPEEDTPLKGLVQISHGMTDYVLRYRTLAEKLTEVGYAVFGGDHLGHGHTARTPDELGYFAPKDGVGYVLDDLHALTRLMKERFPDLPFVLIGHSMGSFLCRLYATRFAYELDGLVILGTGGPNPLLPVGKLFTRTIRLFKGDHYRSQAVANLAFSGYTSHYEKGAHPLSWLSRDPALIEKYEKDPLNRFLFTVQAYLDLFEMVGESNGKTWFSEYPRALRTMIASGTEDPVGSWGRGPAYVAETLKKEGVANVDLYLYEGARHELFNELNADEFFADLISWLDACVKPAV